MLFHLLILRHLFIHIKCRKEIIHHLNRGNIVCLFPHTLDKSASDFRSPSMMCAVSQYNKQITCIKGNPADKFFHHGRHFMSIDWTYDTNAARRKLQPLLLYYLWDAYDFFIQRFCHIQAVSGSCKIKNHLCSLL
jgi:hypothetical protein